MKRKYPILAPSKRWTFKPVHDHGEWQRSIAARSLGVRRSQRSGQSRVRFSALVRQILHHAARSKAPKTTRQNEIVRSRTSRVDDRPGWHARTSYSQTCAGIQYSHVLCTSSCVKNTDQRRQGCDEIAIFHPRPDTRHAVSGVSCTYWLLFVPYSLVQYQLVATKHRYGINCLGKSQIGIAIKVRVSGCDHALSPRRSTISSYLPIIH